MWNLSVSSFSSLVFKFLYGIFMWHFTWYVLITKSQVLRLCCCLIQSENCWPKKKKKKSELRLKRGLYHIRRFITTAQDNFIIAHLLMHHPGIEPGSFNEDWFSSATRPLVLIYLSRQRLFIYTLKVTFQILFVTGNYWMVFSLSPNSYLYIHVKILVFQMFNFVCVTKYLIFSYEFQVTVPMRFSLNGLWQTWAYTNYQGGSGAHVKSFNLYLIIHLWLLFTKFVIHFFAIHQEVKIL